MYKDKDVQIEKDLAVQTVEVAKISQKKMIFYFY